MLSYAAVANRLAEAGAGAVTLRNEFTGFEKFLLAAHVPLDVIARGDVDSGWAVSRALAKGARAVQIGSALLREGPELFARLKRELRTARARTAGGSAP